MVVSILPFSKYNIQTGFIRIVQWRRSWQV